MAEFITSIIAPALFAVTIIGFALGLVWCHDSVTGATIACDCGRSVARDCLLFGDGDRLSVYLYLSESCPTCRALAHDRSLTRSQQKATSV